MTTYYWFKDVETLEMWGIPAASKASAEIYFLKNVGVENYTFSHITEEES